VFIRFFARIYKPCDFFLNECDSLYKLNAYLCVGVMHCWLLAFSLPRNDLVDLMVAKLLLKGRLCRLCFYSLSSTANDVAPCCNQSFFYFNYMFSQAVTAMLLHTIFGFICDVLECVKFQCRHKQLIECLILIGR
jgi:hypothetical protein